MRFYLLLVLVFTVSLSSAQKEEKFAEFNKFLEQEVTEDRIAGSVSLIVKGGEVLHQETFGYCDKEAKTPMAEDQVFHLMSMTKPIVSLAFMMLYEEGHFKLDEPVSKYLEGFDNLMVAKDITAGKAGGAVPVEMPITILQALTHTAGFGHGLSGSQLDNELAMAMYFAPQDNIASRVKTLTSMPLPLQPGTKWSYSASPDILALLIEKFSGQTVADFLQERIFAPLNMEDTGYNLSSEKAARLAKLYTVADGKLVNDPRQMGATGNKVYGGTHGLLSTAADYGKFCQFLLDKGATPAGKQLIKPETIALMTKDHLGDIPYAEGKGFGLGFGIDLKVPEDGLGAAGRYYWSGAYSTFFFVDPVNDLYAILMTQLSPHNGSLGEDLRKHVYEGMK